MVFAHPEMKYKEKDVVQFDYLDWPYLPSEEIPYWNHKPLSYDMKIIQGDADPVFKFVQFIKRNPLQDTAIISFNGSRFVSTNIYIYIYIYLY